MKLLKVNNEIDINQYKTLIEINMIKKIKNLNYGFFVFLN